MSDFYQVEADWISKAGLRCVVIASQAGWRCGYVAVGQTHPLYGHYYSRLSPYLKRGGVFYSPVEFFTVHGDITFSDFGNYYLLPKNSFWFGFDCAHSGDAFDPDLLPEDTPECRNAVLNRPGIVRTLEFVKEECESLARQLSEVTA